MIMWYFEHIYLKSSQINFNFLLFTKSNVFFHMQPEKNENSENMPLENDEANVLLKG